MTEIASEEVEAGIALYSRFLLSIYDWLLLGYFSRFVWKCPASRMLELYNRHVTANHLDIGVGSGYFMDYCTFPAPNPRLALMDLNPNSLDVASKRLARYNPEVYQRNALEQFNLESPPFDSIGMMNLLHCLPGNMDTKWIVFKNARKFLNPGGTIFGSTVLYQGVSRNILATLQLKYNNHKGFMTNLDDDIEQLRENLRKGFSDSDVQIVGCEALFWARA
jgi:2-polyprenyl-3-methyl-5-hydroxy-6-metoxy-1,4-benzoquinol methylase